MKTFLNLGIKMALPIINLMLSKGISIPDSLFDGKLLIQEAVF
jgi:hypothetical protein